MNLVSCAGLLGGKFIDFGVARISLGSRRGHAMPFAERGVAQHHLDRIEASAGNPALDVSSLRLAAVIAKGFIHGIDQ
jgi:hypothetical protein